MPAFNLTTDGAEVEDVSIRQTGNNITVDGTYILEVKNTGVLPLLMSATVQIDELEVTGVTAEEDETETISGSGEVEVDFSFEQTAAQYQSTANSICNGSGELDAEMSGTIKGIVASSSFSEDAETTIPGSSCNLGSGGSTPSQPPSTDPQPPSTDPIGSPDDPNDGNTGGSQQPNFQIVNLNGQEGNYDDPYVGTTQTYQVQDPSGNRVDNYPTGEYNWVWQFGNETTKDSASFQEIVGSPAQVDYNWNETGQKTITVTVTNNNTNRTTFQLQKPENVVENPDDGWFSQDRGRLEADDIPSMEDAANRKRNSKDAGF